MSWLLSSSDGFNIFVISSKAGGNSKPIHQQKSPIVPLHLQKLDRNLSGESFSHTPPEVEATVIIKQASSCSTLNSYNSRSPSPQNYCAATLNLNDPSKYQKTLLCHFAEYSELFRKIQLLPGVELTKRKCWLSPDGATLNNRRGKFIVLGSSGECLPVTRPPNQMDTQEDSLYSSCNSSDDEFHSANDSFDYGESISEFSHNGFVLFKRRDLGR